MGSDFWTNLISCPNTNQQQGGAPPICHGCSNYTRKPTGGAAGGYLSHCCIDCKNSQGSQHNDSYHVNTKGTGSKPACCNKCNQFQLASIPDQPNKYSSKCCHTCPNNHPGPHTACAAGVVDASVNPFGNKLLGVRCLRTIKGPAGYYSRQLVRQYSTLLFLFGENNRSKGLKPTGPNDPGWQTSTQAVIRGEPNAVGIRTVWYTSVPNFQHIGHQSTMSDKTLDENKKVIDQDINEAIKLWKTGDYTHVIIPHDGIGTGVANLPTKAPLTYAYLQERLDYLCTQPENQLNPVTVPTTTPTTNSRAMGVATHTARSTTSDNNWLSVLPDMSWRREILKDKLEYWNSRKWNDFPRAIHWKKYGFWPHGSWAYYQQAYRGANPNSPVRVWQAEYPYPKSYMSILTAISPVVFHDTFYRYNQYPHGWWVDFAARHLGGGVLGQGFVQEEVMFTAFPEALAIVKLKSPMIPDRGALLLTNMLQAFHMDDSISARHIANTKWGDPTNQSTNTHTGKYRGRDKVLRDATELLNATSIQNHIYSLDTMVIANFIAVNAVNHGRYKITQVEQYNVNELRRALNKLYSGFIAARYFMKQKAPNQPTIIHTGAWGAGAFSNHLETMLVIQYIAAQLAGIDEVHFWGPGLQPRFYQSFNHIYNYLLNKLK